LSPRSSSRVAPSRRRSRAPSPGTPSRVSDTTYGIFDTFEDEEGRQAHLGGRIPEALGQVGPDLLATDPDIRPVDVIAVK
jgi:hypothetical protein